MAVSIKSEKEIELMRVSCKNLSVMFDELEKIIKPGISTWEINKVGEEIIRDFDASRTSKTTRDIRLQSVLL